MPKRRQVRALTRIYLLLLIAAAPSLAQINAGALPPAPELPFAMRQVATFEYPWRIAFLPDGRMLVTEKPGRLWLVTQDGAKQEVAGAPTVQYDGGNGGLLGVFLSPTYRTRHDIYLTYSEGDEGGSSLALGHATLILDGGVPRLDKFERIWREMPKGQGGEFGGAVAFSPDGKYLFLGVGHRARIVPAQDMSQALGKVLRLTLDGRPAPGNPFAGQQGEPTVALIDPPADTEAAKTAPVVSRYTYPGPNLTPAEIWTTGMRTPYGLAFDPEGRLWELENGPHGGDELNRLEPGRNYGWPLVSYGVSYNGKPIPKPDTRPDLVQPIIYWDPVIVPSSLAFYSGKMFPQWKGSAFAGGLASMTLSRIAFDGKGGATAAERWDMKFRVRDVEQAPDGALWILNDAKNGGLYRLTPK